MIYHTFLDKCNTIIRNSQVNTGINAVGELTYGATNSRLLVHFPIDKLKEFVEDKTMPDSSKMKHYLCMTNASGIDLRDTHCKHQSSSSMAKKIRATSFDIIFFLIPKEWDRGKGFSFMDEAVNINTFTGEDLENKRLVSVDGCNWYQRKNGLMWDEGGVYSTSTLEKEYNNWSSEVGSSIIIGRQHFDVGDEDIKFDVTDIVNKYISGELENYGIGMAFTPGLEESGLEDGDSYTVKDFTDWVEANLTENDMKKPLQQALNTANMPAQNDAQANNYALKENSLGYSENYVGFFTDKTPNFFEPYLETVYDDHILDDRASFALNKKNRLYFYSSIGGNPVNLDNLPSCRIINDDDEQIGDEYEVKQTSTGAYYIEVMFSAMEYESNTMFHDVWYNISYDGVTFPEVELDFTLVPATNWIGLGSSFASTSSFTPTISGIKADEEIERGDKRKLTIDAKVNYTNSTSKIVDNVQLRLYIKDGTRELDVIPFHSVNKTFNEIYEIIDTNMLIPQKYYVDVKFKYNMQELVHHDVLHFKVMSMLNNKFF